MGGILVKISHEMLKNQAELTGFRTDILEKVGLLIHLLEALRSHPFLKGRLALKGGTALNLEDRHQGLGALLPFTATEMEFLDRLLARGEINPELLTANENLQDRIRRHPLLEWKALNVREFVQNR